MVGWVLYGLKGWVMSWLGGGLVEGLLDRLIGWLGVIGLVGGLLSWLVG